MVLLKVFGVMPAFVHVFTKSVSVHLCARQHQNASLAEMPYEELTLPINPVQTIKEAKGRVPMLGKGIPPRSAISSFYSSLA